MYGPETISGPGNTAMKVEKKEYHLGEGNKEVSRIHPKSFTTSMCIEI